MKTMIGNRKMDNKAGRKYGLLFVIEHGGYAQNSISGKRTSLWVCKCDCGNVTSVRGGDLETGNTTSCGCKWSKNKTNLIHGKYHTRTYRSWANMIQRCTNQNNTNFHNYGGRGVTVCEKWKTFDGFLEDMGECVGKLTIDRIDVNGNYEKGNCRWITQKENTRNKRNATVLYINGEEISLPVAADKFCINYKTLRSRVTELGWPAHIAVLAKPNTRLRKAAELMADEMWHEFDRVEEVA